MQTYRTKPTELVGSSWFVFVSGVESVRMVSVAGNENENGH